MKVPHFVMYTAVIIVAVTGCATRFPTLPPAEYRTGPTDERLAFVYSDPDEPYLTKLRAEFGLEEIVAGAETDLEKIRAVNAWVHGLWRHHGWNQPERNDPMSILREVAEGKRFRCVEYAIVINGCLNSLGLRSRVLALKTEDVQTRNWGAGHVVAEAFERELGILTEKMTWRKAERFFGWITEYLYHFDVRIDLRVPPQTPGSIILLPVGTVPPTVFQKRYPITNMTYTNSVAAFYAEP